LRCFNHTEPRAVGICKNCGKGLCHDCLTDLGFALACKEKCEIQLIALHEHNRMVVKDGRKYYARTANYFFLVSAFFIVGSYFFGLSPVSVIFAVVGLFMAFMGWKNRQAAKG
jgi:hypothetical protein